MGKGFSMVVTSVLALIVQSAVAQNCQNINGITQSTLKLVSPSKACETTADLYFTYSESNGSRPLVYGTTTSYGTSGGDVAGSRSKTINLKNLQPNTKYYFKVDGIYQGGTKYTMKGEFTTQSTAVSTINNMTFEKSKMLINICNNSISIPTSIDKELSIELFSLNGSLVMKHSLQIGGYSAFVPVNMVNGKGTYICKIKGANTSYSQKVILSN